VGGENTWESMVVPPVPLLHSSRVFPRIDSDNRSLQ